MTAQPERDQSGDELDAIRKAAAEGKLATTCMTCGTEVLIKDLMPPLASRCPTCPEIRRGLADIEAGRLRSFEDVFGEPQ